MARVILALAIAAGIAAMTNAETGALPGVANPERARQNYILKCQGCHSADASRDASNTPPMAGMVSRFLAVAGGREFLVRVPGVSTAALNDAELAELLNWTLYRFDPGHVPEGFKPYNAAEIAKLRKIPLRTEASALRASLIAQIPTHKN